MRRMIKNIFVCLFIMSVHLVHAQETCYTEWENKLVKEINDYRTKNGFRPYAYSQQLTEVAVYNAEHPAEFKRASEKGYKGSSMPFSLTFSFEYESPADALESIFYYPDQKQYFDNKGAVYTHMGLARIKNSVILFLGDQQEDAGNFPLCEPVPVVDKGYTWLIEPNEDFWDMQRFNAGKYMAVRNINQWGVCDDRGRMVLDFNYWSMAAYDDSGHFIVVKSIEDQKEFIIDTTGKVVEEFAHDGYIMLGKNRVAYEGDYNYIVDENMKRISEKYHDIYLLDSNVLAFQKGNLYGIMDFNGKIIVQPKYGEIMAYSEGKAAVKIGSKWGYIDRNFTMVIQPIVTEKMDFYFEGGMVPFKQNGKVGYLDSTGKVAIQPQFTEGGSFDANGMAPVKWKGKYGLINKQGKFVFPAEYDNIFSYSNGYTGVGKSINGVFKYAIMDSKLRILTDYEFTQFHFLPGGIVKACADGRWGLLKIN